MGKSNDIVFPWYAAMLPKRRYMRVAVLGAVGYDAFTITIVDRNPRVAAEQAIEFYDITSSGSSHWEIESQDWGLDVNAYDLVVCTRCPYFAPSARQFVLNCAALLRRGGVLFLDWGLGDHWRIQPYKVGWERDGQREAVTYGGHESVLSSCMWSPRLEDDAQAKLYRKRIRRFPTYDDERTLTQLIASEVPSVASLDDAYDGLTCVDTRLLALWEDAPQLYIATVFEKVD